MQRLPSRADAAVFGFAMALFYSGLMSGAFTGMAIGWTAAGLAAWPRAWLLGFVIAAPAGFFLRPLAQAIADQVTCPPALKDDQQ